MTKHQTKLLQRNIVGGQNGYECKRCGQQLLAWSAKEANAMDMYPCVQVIPQAPAVDAAIRAIEEKSKVRPASGPYDYPRFKRQMNAIDRKYGFRSDEE